ncbi:MAG: hypothetical protein ISR65_08925 [Bacteriovoracaceae bacterium]|nr:hypothetical protein [Bacteriovoracaceae bacterium]
MISRLAPTPSGYLHIGNAVNFVLTWAKVKQVGGKLALRIDDADAARCKLEFIEDIFYQLDWLGIEYDEGPTGPDDFYKNYSQQAKRDYYFEIIQNLKKQNPLVYACKCSRKSIQQKGGSGVYSGTCRELNLPWEPIKTAIRVLVPQKTCIQVGKQLVCLDQQMGDFVLWRKDNLPSYQVASLIDDRDLGVNLVVRGEDLLTSTAAQLFIARQLDYKKFVASKFIHHPLMSGINGKKLSKSGDAFSIKQMRAKFSCPQAIFKQIATFLKINADEISCLDDFRRLLRVES